LSAFAGTARAQDDGGGGAAVAAAAHTVANGMVIQPRLQTQSSLIGGALGDPGFLIGYRTGDLTIGIGGSFSRTAFSDQGPNEVALTIFQVMPSLSYDVWKSADGRARCNFLAAVGYGHAAVDAKTTDTSTNPATTSTSSDSIGFIPFRVGVGADYFFHPNFGIGGEAGVQSKILTSAKVGNTNPNVSVSDNAVFGALHLTFIIGA
jgi:hypothetical protein